ncbi:Uncharacterised protein [Mycobacteroides abscessus subsp. abscessus]|nr:Uncharacterised protein [Mycobacteroides abscessus subsp. abscessus]
MDHQVTGSDGCCTKSTFGFCHGGLARASISGPIAKRAVNPLSYTGSASSVPRSRLDTSSFQI